MEEYRDSTPDLDRLDRLRSRLAEEGCLFFRGLIPADDVVAVRERTLHALDEAGWLADGTDPRFARPGPEVVNEGDEDFFDAYTLVQAAEPFHALAHHPRLREIAGRLVDDDLLVHPRKIARISFPNNPRGTTPPHQDFRYIQGTTDVFTTWLPLGRCATDLGGLKVLRGSHEKGLMPVHWNDERAVGIEVETDPDDRDWATAEYEPGDVILFHSLTVHGAMPNHTGEIRLSADYRYQSASDPLVAGTLKPHWYPKVPDWPELVSDWRSLAPIETPGEPEINEFVKGFDLPPLGPSRYFEFAGQAA